jgi:hypothetical protein
MITTETTLPKGITKRKINTIRASAQSAPHLFLGNCIPVCFLFFFFVDVRCFITNIDKILTFEKEYHRCQNIED